MINEGVVVLPDYVLVVGDAHGNSVFIMHAIWRAEEMGIETVIFLGDFWFYSEEELEMLDDTVREAQGVREVYFIDGNHEDYRILDAAKRNSLEPVQMSEYLWYLPRGLVGVFESGLTFMTYGGAVSIDHNFRREGKSWWPEENPSEDDLNRALAAANIVGGEIDVLFCHDMSQEFLRGEGLVYPPNGDIVFESRSFVFSDRFTRLVNQIHPQAVFHGHHHRKVSGLMEPGRTGYPHRPCKTFGLGADMTSYADAVADVRFAGTAL